MALKVDLILALLMNLSIYKLQEINKCNCHFPPYNGNFQGFGGADHYFFRLKRLNDGSCEGQAKGGIGRGWTYNGKVVGVGEKTSWPTRILIVSVCSDSLKDLHAENPKS